MHSDPFETQLVHSQIEVMLDGLPVTLPAERSSLIGIRSYLETIALERQRILCSFSVDGEQANLSHQLTNRKKFHRVEARTITLDEMPLQILRTALEQVAHAYERVESAVTLVLVNDGCVAREFWWGLAKELKDPLLTLSLLPDNICGPDNGRASFTQLRKWQLQQLASIIKDVDEACHLEDTILLSNALDNRVLPWLQNLSDLISLWHDTVAAGSQFALEKAA